MTGAASSWQVCGASCRGRMHIRTGRPNEDAFAFQPEAGAASRIVASVSDGHGSAPHFRSGKGAEIAAQTISDILAWNIDSPDEDELDDGLAGQIIAHWRESIFADAEAHPFSKEEEQLCRGLVPIAYGSTLIGFVANGQLCHMLQIGDGDLLLGFADGRIERPLRADEGLHGEETYSLCQDDAEQHFRVASLWREVDGRWPDFAMLATDGVSKSFADDAAFYDAAAQLRSLAFEDWDALTGELAEWLDRVSQHGSGDDSTMCIAIRQGARD